MITYCSFLLFYLLIPRHCHILHSLSVPFQIYLQFSLPLRTLRFFCNSMFIVLTMLFPNSSLKKAVPVTSMPIIKDAQICQVHHLPEDRSNCFGGWRLGRLNGVGGGNLQGHVLKSVLYWFGVITCDTLCYFSKNLAPKMLTSLTWIVAPARNSFLHIPG